MHVSPFGPQEASGSIHGSEIGTWAPIILFHGGILNATEFPITEARMLAYCSDLKWSPISDIEGISCSNQVFILSCGLDAATNLCAT